MRELVKVGAFIGFLILLFNGSVQTLVAIFIVLGVLIAVGAWLLSQENDEAEKFRSQINQEIDAFDPDHKIQPESSQSDVLKGGIAISTKNKKLAIWEPILDPSRHAGQLETFFKIYDSADVLEFKVEVNQEVVQTTKSQDGLARAALGGLLFGGAGAVVGAVTAASVGAEESNVRNVSIGILLDSVDEPLIGFKVFELPEGAKSCDFEREAESSIAKATFISSVWMLLQENVVVERAITPEKLANVMRIWEIKCEKIVDPEEQKDVLRSLLARAASSIKA